MSIKVVTAVLAIALIGTLAGYHFTHRGHHNHASTNTTNNATNESHYVPNKVLMFKAYKEENKLKFGASEDSKRFEIFADNVDYITQKNAKQSSYELGVTSFAHLTTEEFATLMARGKISDVNDEAVDEETLAAYNTNEEVFAPWGDIEEVDWVAKGAVTPVLRQGSCGSCWAFSATGALEGLQAIKTGKLIPLSKQELVDCARSYNNFGCNGGDAGRGMTYVQDHGIASEDDYPYIGVDLYCKHKPKTFKNTGVERIRYDRRALIAAIKNQPVSVGVAADSRDFQLYRGGVLTGLACGDRVGHDVLAVGYGVKDGISYIKVKNSWGSTWGVNGYIYIAQTESVYGVCGIYKDTSYPTLRNRIFDN